MIINRCMNCMREYETGEEVCPVCGNRHGQEEQPEQALRCGAILRGKYLVGKVMGQGGFGITYVGQDLVLNLKVAIKEYFPASMASRSGNTSLLWHSSVVSREEGCEGFLKEARKMARIDKIPSVVSVRDMFLENETAYIVMDFVEGETLKAKLKREGPMKFSECVRLLGPVMDGLEKVHEQGMIHRDIKPDNIMIQPDGAAMLLDLGAAKELDPRQRNQGATTNLVVSQGFSPLEQYMDSGKIGPWSDVYALCATIYYCITGKMPKASLDRIQDDKLDFSVPMKEALSSQSQEALRKGMALKCEDRIQSVGELKRILAGAAPAAPTDGGKKKKAVAVAAAAAAVIAVGVGVILAVTGKSTREPIPAVTVAEYGQSNANVANCGEYLTRKNDDEGFEYFIGADNELRVCARDEDGVFYINDAPAVAENASFLCQSSDAVFFLAGDEGQEAICRMEPDGSGIEELYATEGDLLYLQYVSLSDGSPYLYFLEMSEAESIDELTTRIGRYALADGSIETVIDEELVNCYSLGREKLYYTVWDLDGSTFVLKQAELDGRDKSVLVTDKNLVYGFVEEDENLLFMYSYTDLAMLAYNPDGTRNNELAGTYGQNVAVTSDYVPIGYGNDWFFYKNSDDASLHRIRLDGTGDSLLAEGTDAVSICYDDSWLYVSVTDEEENRSCYFLYWDGSGDVVPVGSGTDEMPAMESAGNLSNGGWLSRSGANAVLMVPDYGLLAAGDDVDGISLIREEEVSALNLIGDVIYYLNSEGEIYRCNLDGSEEEYIYATEGRTGKNLIVTADYYYYTATNRADDFYSILQIDKEDTSQGTAIVDDCSNPMTVALYDGWLYYCSSQDGGTYRVRTDGTERMKVYDGDAKILVVSAAGVYGCQEHALWRSEWDGSDGGVFFSQGYNGVSFTGMNVNSEGTVYVAYYTEDNGRGIGTITASDSSITRFYTETGSDVTFRDVLMNGSSSLYCIADQGGTPHVYFINNEGEMSDISGQYLGETAEGLQYMLRSDEEAVIYGYRGSSTAVSIPEEIEGLPVTEICEDAFAFSSVESVTLPRSIRVIQEDAFFFCLDLTELELPEGLEEIGGYAFAWCGLTQVALPESLKRIGESAFYCTELTEVYIPAGLEYIGPGAFACLSPEFTAFEVDPANPYFQASSLGNLYSADGRILYAAPTGATGRIELSGSVEEIYGEAFSDCEQLESIVLPDSVVSIGDGAFAFCSGLTNLVIPASVQSIGSSILYDCENLASVTISRDCQYAEDAFDEYPGIVLFYEN